MSNGNKPPEWLRKHYDEASYSTWYGGQPYYSHDANDVVNTTLTDVAFNKHSVNDGEHVSPYDENTLHVGTAGLEVEIVKWPDAETYKNVLSSATRATVGLDPRDGGDPRDWEEMMRGGLQGALESDTIVFRVYRASRALTHQLVRTRNAAFNQQSQRATWYGARPDVRMPLSVYRNERARDAFEEAVKAAWHAYEVACEEDISYQDARFVLPEGTVNFIQCTYTVREFINVFAYRGCSMFMWEMVDCMRKMRKLLVEKSPWLEPYVKISCEKTGSTCPDCRGMGEERRDDFDADPFADGGVCTRCDGTGTVGRKCTFQGWESPEGQCDFPWAKEENRTFKPMFHTIGKRPGLQ